MNELNKLASSAIQIELPMVLGAEQRKILELIAAGIPHLARIMSAVPAEHQATTFEAAENSYLQTIRQMGLSQAPKAEHGRHQ
jgi:hypothetical protein